MKRKANGRPWQRRHDSVDLTYLRERLLAKIGRLTPKWPSQLHREVEDDLGDVCEKRVERCLKWLLDQGAIRRTPEGYLLAPQRSRSSAVPKTA